MARAKVIIGAGYGDEGKGLMTDYFSSQSPDSLIVRFNGGAQAGHTVVSPDNVRHVFSHFGSGTLNGCDTYLSHHFVCNPILFKKEHLELDSKHCAPKVYVHPLSLITTPYDMIINQALEMHRGNDRHGSVGVGFGETIERVEWYFSTAVTDLFYSKHADILFMLERIRREYLPYRLTKKQFEPFKDMDFDLINRSWLESLNFFFSTIKIQQYKELKNKELIFEGAQGLMLDMEYGYFPHVTRSYCGLRNVRQIINWIDKSIELDAYYVSRLYRTRHGAGPLLHECSLNDLDFNAFDSTNKKHQYQGPLRFGRLDHRELNSFIERDFTKYSKEKDTCNVVFTCLDQAKYPEYLDYAQGTAQYVSYGPTRNDIECCR